jgi:inosose dehydratase
MAETRYSRREFLHGVVGAAAVTRVVRSARRAGKIRFGYASITWNGKDLQAIDEIAALGFPGIQLRSNILPQFEGKPKALKDLLAKRKLTFVAFSSGAVKLDHALEKQIIDEHVSHARFLRDAGGRFLQITDERPAGRTVTAADCARLGALLTEIGKRTAEIGIPVCYHPHMGTVGEKPEDSDRVLAAADPRDVKLLLDVAHYQQGGGDPVAAIRKHRDRLSLLHLKDVETVASSKSGYRFVELGRGRVDIKGVIGALSEIGFDGWCVVELDDVPDPSRTPADCARTSKRYLEGLGFSIQTR